MIFTPIGAAGRAADAASALVASSSSSFRRTGFRFTGKKLADVQPEETRYHGSRLVEYAFGDVRVVTQEMWRYLSDGEFPIPSEADRYLEVGSSEDGRPDLVAVRAYGPSGHSLWWYVMWANGLMDFEEVVAGTTLRIPPEPLSTASSSPDPEEESS